MTARPTVFAAAAALALAAIGGLHLMVALGFDAPAGAFVSADAAFYRPLCAGLAALIATDLVLGRRARTQTAD